MRRSEGGWPDLYSEIQNLIVRYIARYGDTNYRWNLQINVNASFGTGKTHTAMELSVYTASGMSPAELIVRACYNLEPTYSTLIAATRRAIEHVEEAVRELWGRRGEIYRFLEIPEEVRRRVCKLFILAGSPVACINERVLNTVQQMMSYLQRAALMRLFATLFRLYTVRPPSEQWTTYRHIQQLISRLLQDYPNFEALREEIARGLFRNFLNTLMDLSSNIRRGEIFLMEDEAEWWLRLLAEITAEYTIEASMSVFCAACPLNNRAICQQFLGWCFRQTRYIVISTFREQIGTPEERALIERGLYATARDAVRAFQEETGHEVCPYRVLIRLFLYEPPIRRGEINIGVSPDEMRYVMIATHRLFTSTTTGEILHERYGRLLNLGVCLPHMVIIDEPDVLIMMPVESAELPVGLVYMYRSAEELDRDVVRLFQEVNLDPETWGGVSLRRVVAAIFGHALRLEDIIRRAQEDRRVVGAPNVVAVLEDVIRTVYDVRAIRRDMVNAAVSTLQRLKTALAGRAQEEGFQAVVDLIPTLKLCEQCVYFAQVVRRIPDRVFDSPELLAYWIEVPRVHLEDVESVNVRHEYLYNLILLSFPLIIVRRFDHSLRILLDHTYPYPARVKLLLSATLTKEVLEDSARAVLPEDLIEQYSTPRKRIVNVAKLEGRDWIIYMPRYENVYLFLSYVWAPIELYLRLRRFGHLLRTTTMLSEDLEERLATLVEEVGSELGERRADFLYREDITGLSRASTVCMNLHLELVDILERLREVANYTSNNIFLFLIFGTQPQYNTFVTHVRQELAGRRIRVENYILSISRLEHYQGRPDLAYMESRIGGINVRTLITYARGREGRGVDIDVLAREGELAMSYVISEPLRQPLSLRQLNVFSREEQILENIECAVSAVQAGFRVVRRVRYTVPRVVVFDLSLLDPLLVRYYPDSVKTMIHDALENGYITSVAEAIINVLGVELPV